MSNFVLVLDTNKRPLDPVHPSTARLLLNQQKAAVFRRFPFTIILKESKPDVITQPIELKIDPGSKTTGITLVQNNKVIWGGELQHRGFQISDSLLTRRAIRRSRRSRHTRYRQARFLNRTKSACWLAPSLQHRVDTMAIGKGVIGRVVVQSATRLEIRVKGVRYGGRLSEFRRLHLKDSYDYT
jgi:hypothetical protein